MAKEIILHKSRMYQLLKAGEFGNTIPQFMSVDEWNASPDSKRIPFWGIRSSKIPGHPACIMHCPADQVEEYAIRHFGADAVNISMMVDLAATVLAWLEIVELPCGLVVEGTIAPDVPEWTWRNTMRNPERTRQWEGSAAKLLLESVLNENSLADMEIVLGNYPGHVVELTALDACMGLVPHRNAIVWEVRAY